MAVRNDWHLLAWRQFEEQFMQLLARVRRLKEKDPAEYHRNTYAKLLAALLEVTERRVPRDPGADDFRQGNTLGPEFRHWRRVKFFGRYRLFFRYSATRRAIVYSWVNDEKAKRKSGDAKDPYVLFRKALERGAPPDDFGELLGESKPFDPETP